MARLSYDPNLVLIISERTSYLLQNLVVADIADSNRYAIYPPFDGNYQPIDDRDAPEYAIFEFIARQANLEVLEVGTMPLSLISSVASEYYTATAAAAFFTKTFSTVPANECWEVEAWMTRLSTVITIAEVEILVQGGYLARYAAPAANVEQVTLARVTLGPGAALRFAWTGCTPGVTVVVARYNYRVLPLG